MLLDQLLHRLVECDPTITEKVYPSRDEISRSTDEYRKHWATVGPQYVRTLERVLGLAFAQAVIDVHVVGRTRPMSRPFLLPSHFTSEELEGTVAHELVHHLLADNTAGVKGGDVSRVMFPGADPLVSVHTIIFACLSMTFSALQRPERTAELVERDENDERYRASWELVRRLGTKPVVETFRARAGLEPM